MNLKTVFVYIYTLSSLTATVAMASEGGEHGAEHAITVPWANIWPQVFNFTLLVGLIVFLARKHVVQYFLNRRDLFTAAVRRAKDAKERAEIQKADLTERLKTLNDSADESIQKARSEADALKQQIIEEAKSLSQTLREEAQRTAHYEVERAKAELRKEMLNESIQNARKILTESLNEPDQRRLQTEFVDKIQVVR